MSITFAIDTDATLELRKKLATDNIILFTALGEAEKKAEWLSYYQQLNTLTDTSTVMDISLPE